MAEPEDTLARSPVDFDSAVAYALHPEMRRLIILYLVGTLLLPIGLSMFLDPFTFGGLARLIRRVIGLGIMLVGATFFFGGVVGAAFKLVADANILAAALFED
ncbi:hypothetical protein [Halosimplex halobium]|uniref:hypothetical protein n=1 Tax=Halosimplex halobium TaxID=3396618 RepID=UPI003F55E14D